MFIQLFNRVVKVLKNVLSGSSWCIVSQNEPKKEMIFQKLAIVCNSSLSKNTQEEMNNSEDEDP